MADPFSLISRSSEARSLSPAAPVAKPSFFDQLFGRGKYMEEFSSRRGEIIKASRQERKQLSREARRTAKKYEKKLWRDDRELYQEFGIRQAQRGSAQGLDEREQQKLRHKAWRKIQKEMREQQREAERAIERRRDQQIKTMRDQLREELYRPPA